MYENKTKIYKFKLNFKRNTFEKIMSKQKQTKYLTQNKKKVF